MLEECWIKEMEKLKWSEKSIQGFLQDKVQGFCQLGMYITLHYITPIKEISRYQNFNF